MESPSKSKKEQVDFLSDLTEPIFHHILSFLDIKHVARVSSLSRRCRQICLSSPFLTIALGNVRHQEFYRFRDFVRRFMSLRDNGVGIHQIEVEMLGDNNFDGFEFHIANWLLEAISRFNVEKICLRFFRFESFTLPGDVLNSACLRDLEVYAVLSGGLLKFPSTTSFGGLENLRLGFVRVSVEFGNWISSCNSLKMLYLEQVVVEHGLDISSSSLEDLRIEGCMLCSRPDGFKIKVSAKSLKNLHIESHNDDKSLNSLTLHAPKLERFFWAGFACNYFCEGNLESLCYSDISVEFTSIFNDEYDSLDNGIIGKVLQSMHRVSSMCIRDISIKEITSPELVPKFYNLCSLTLIRTDSSVEIPSTISLLTLMPHLSTLKLKGDLYTKNEMICYTAEYLESQNLKFVHSLKEVEMEISIEENDLELIKYLLKNAEALETMTFHYSYALRHRQSEISINIRQFQRASSSVTINFFHCDL